MGGGVLWGFGARFLYDSHLRYFRPGFPCYLRLQNYVTPESGYAELGFQFTPSGALQPEQTGFTDILIKPPVEAWSGGSPKSSGQGGDIGLNQARLMFYERQFYVSHTFVKARMDAQGFIDGYQVWRDPSIIGLIYDNRLHKINSVGYEQVAAETIAWVLDTSYQETIVTVQGS